VAFIFAGCPPGELLELRRFGYLIASTADCQGVEKVDDVGPTSGAGSRWWLGARSWPRGLTWATCRGRRPSTF